MFSYIPSNSDGTMRRNAKALKSWVWTGYDEDRHRACLDAYWAWRDDQPHIVAYGPSYEQAESRLAFMLKERGL